MSCGVPATPTGKALAKQKAAQIELDISAGYFDPTLLKYKPRMLGKTATELSVVELFERYAQAMKREKGLSNSGYQKYKSVISHLTPFFKDAGAESVTDRRSGDFTAYLLERMAGQTAKQYLFLLRACWQWTEGKYHVMGNPWVVCAEKRIEAQPLKRVKPFAEPEIKTILAGFQGSKVYGHYHSVVLFLFSTAVRPGEAFALKWGSIADDFSHVVIREAVSRGESRGRTKTGKTRIVHLSNAVSEMLRDQKACLTPKDSALVFPSPTGKTLDDHNFSRRGWKAVLKSAGVEFRSIYAIRHSAITLALRNGANPSELSEQSGHSKMVMLKVYDHAISKQSLFVEF
jgi:integrase